MSWTSLTEAQAAVSRKVLAVQGAQRDHLVVSLSGAHAYGFPSADSDVDLKAVHVVPTVALLGLRPPKMHADFLGVVDGVEVDYTSNEIGEVLAGILKGNGNYLERVFGSFALDGTPDLASLRSLLPKVLSRRFRNHYAGFARQQLRAFESGREAKKALYVLRTTLTGRHLLRTGEVQTDVTKLFGEAGFDDAAALVKAKRTAEKAVLDDATFEHWRARLERAFALLDEAEASSPLPPEPRGVNEVEAWLIALRKARL